MATRLEKFLAYYNPDTRAKVELDLHIEQAEGSDKLQAISLRLLLSSNLCTSENRSTSRAYRPFSEFPRNP